MKFSAELRCVAFGAMDIDGPPRCRLLFERIGLLGPLRRIRIVPRFSANISMLYGEYDFYERFSAAKRDGFDAVEFLFPYSFDVDRLVEVLHKNALTLVLHNLPAGKWDQGERGIACLPDRVDEFQQGVESAIKFAKTLSCRQVNCLIGIPPAAADFDTVHGTVVENLRFAARELEDAGIKLLIEPINRVDVPGFWLGSAAQAEQLIVEVSSENLFLQYDVYHQQRMSGELAGSFRKYRDRIAHIQIADNPGRNEPGTGEINYPFLFDLLDSEGYSGWVGCEYKPLTTASAGLGWMARHTNSLKRAEAGA